MRGSRNECEFRLLCLLSRSALLVAESKINFEFKLRYTRIIDVLDLGSIHNLILKAAISAKHEA